MNLDNFKIRIYKLILKTPVINVIAYALYIFWQANKLGLFRSIIKNMPLSGSKQPIPWLTHGTIHFFNSLNLAGMSMVEFGSGNSTIWFSKRVRNLISFESDWTWANIVRGGINSESSIELRSEDYKFSLSDFAADIILIDAYDRVSIIENVSNSILRDEISPFFVIIDNSNWYPKLIDDVVRNINYLRIDFLGPTSALWSESQTTVLISRKVKSEIFYGKLRSNNCISNITLPASKEDKNLNLG